MKNDIFNHLTVGNSAFSEVIEEGHGYITFPKLKGPLGPRMKFNGKEKIVWSLNDYLGLATDSKILEADRALAARYGLSYPMGSRIMSGNLDMHEELESALAAYVHKESAILLNYGYPGVVSSIDALLNRHDVVIYDEESHACIIDGVRLHRGKRMMFRHNDIDHLEKQLKRALDIVAVSGGGRLVISEGVFSMRGDQGRLKEIVALKSRYPFRLFVDDAHGFGVLGPGGRGQQEDPREGQGKGRSRSFRHGRISYRSCRSAGGCCGPRCRSPPRPYRTHRTRSRVSVISTPSWPIFCPTRRLRRSSASGH